MVYKKCKYENDNNNMYCINCGNKLYRGQSKTSNAFLLICSIGSILFFTIIIVSAILMYFFMNFLVNFPD